MKRISQVHIDGLFGEADRDVLLDGESGLSILVGPNGSGKSTILRMLAGAWGDGMNVDPAGLLDERYRSMTVWFDDGSGITVTPANEVLSVVEHDPNGPDQESIFSPRPTTERDPQSGGVDEAIEDDRHLAWLEAEPAGELRDLLRSRDTSSHLVLEQGPEFACPAARSDAVYITAERSANTGLFRLCAQDLACRLLSERNGRAYDGRVQLGARQKTLLFQRLFGRYVQRFRIWEVVPDGLARERGLIEADAGYEPEYESENEYCDGPVDGYEPMDWGYEADAEDDDDYGEWRPFFWREALGGLKDKDGFWFRAEWDGSRIPERKLSTGERSLFLMLYAAAFLAERSGLMLVDEPEVSLHLSWQFDLVRSLKQCLGQSPAQLIVATHSPAVLNQWWDSTVEVGVQKVTDHG